MNNFIWLLTVKAGDTLQIASIKNNAPNAGDLVELEDGTLAVVVMRSIYSGTKDTEYQSSVSVVPPKRVVACYNRYTVEEETDAAE